MPIMDSFDELTKWDGWSKDAKPWDKQRPFHRINSPLYDETMARQPNGNGYNCGCRNPDKDYETSLTEIIVSIILAAGLNIIGVLVSGLVVYVKEQSATDPPWLGSCTTRKSGGQKSVEYLGRGGDGSRRFVGEELSNLDRRAAPPVALLL